jgi:hypothetical protein
VDDLLPVMVEDMIAEVRRECAMRRQVYGRLVADRKMNKRLANRRIDVMDALLAYLEARCTEPSEKPTS